MSDDYNSYDSKKRRNSKNRNNSYKNGKGVKVYFEVKQTDGKNYDSEKNYDRDDNNYQQRSHGGQNRQYDNNYYKNNNQNNKNSKREQQVYQKKDERPERYDQNRNFEQDFPPMGSNSQGYGRDAQKSVNNGNRGYNTQYESYSNAGNNADTRSFSNNNRNYGNSYAERGNREFVRWDDGGGKDIFETLDMKSVDAELRGRKNQTGEQGRSQQQYEAIEERKANNNARLQEDKDERPIEWDTSEEQGEFSNIDMIFEQKLKNNLVAYDEEDDLYAPPRNEKTTLNNEGEDEEPEWGDVDVNDVKKTTDTLDSVFFKGGDKQRSQNSQSNSSRFEKVFGMDSNDEFSSLESRDSGSKGNLTSNMMYQQPTLEQQQEYLRQMQMKSLEMGGGGMRFMNNGNAVMQMNDLNRVLLNGNGGNKPAPQNQMYNPYVYYQQQQQLNAMQAQQNYIQAQNKQVLMQTQPKLQPTIKVFEKFSGPNYGKKLWYYIDRSGKRQGPFTGEEMDEWYKGGYLPGDLIITFGENNGYRQLQELVKKVEESLPKANPNPNPGPGLAPTPNFNKLLPGMNMPNLSNLTSFQLSELMKNPDFVQNAQKAGYDLNKVMISLIEREQVEKQTKTRTGTTSAPIITGTFDSQGVYYPVNNPQYTMRQFQSQSPTKDGNGEDLGDNKQGLQPNYPMQQHLQYQYTAQGYMPNTYGNNIMAQNPVNSSMNQNQPGQQIQANTDQLASQLKSLLGVSEGLNDLLGNKEQGIGTEINTNDFPPLG